MQQIYIHSNEHFDVFTTVLAPQGRCQFRAEAEKMVVVHGYQPQWPDEMELTPGDIILVLYKHAEGRWFGRLQSGQRGYFPASCVMELSQANLLKAKDLRRTVSIKSSVSDDAGVRRRYQTGHILQALRRGGRAGGGAPGLEQSQDVPVQRPLDQEPRVMGSQRSPNLLHRILSKYRKKSDSSQGTTNGAFESD